MHGIAASEEEIVLATDRGLYRSVDGAASWTPIIDNLPAHLEAGPLVRDPVDPVEDHPTGALCAHGNPNVLTADVRTSRLSQGCTGQHVLVQIERFDGPPPPVTAGQPS